MANSLCVYVYFNKYIDFALCDYDKTKFRNCKIYSNWCAYIIWDCEINTNCCTERINFLPRLLFDKLTTHRDIEKWEMRNIYSGKHNRIHKLREFEKPKKK